MLEGTSREPPNSVGSFGARLTQDFPVPSEEWTKVPYDKVLWDTGGTFDPRHGAFVAPRNMLCGFMAAGHVAIQYAVAIVRLDFALYKNGSLEVEGESGGAAPRVTDYHLTTTMHMTSPSPLGSPARIPG
jgi:hypothetical protein